MEDGSSEGRSHSLDGPARPPRRLIVRAVVRTLGALAACFLVYAVVPLGGGSGQLVARAAVLVVATTIVVILHARAVHRSDTPGLRAVEAISVSVVLVLVSFAAIHVAVSGNDAGAFSEDLDRVDGLYLSMMTMTTVGFGDIGTVSSAARIAVMSQMVVNVVVLGLAARYALLHARARPSSAPGDDGR